MILTLEFHRECISWSITFGVVAITFWTVLALTGLKKKYADNEYVQKLSPWTIGIINPVAVALLSQMSGYERKYTNSDQTISNFHKFLLLQFLNNVVVSVLISLNIGGFWTIFHPFGILDGDYTDFQVNWYEGFGMTICLTLWIQNFTPHIEAI